MHRPLEPTLLLARHDENGEPGAGTKTTRLAGLTELDAMVFCIDVKKKKKSNPEEIHCGSLSIKCYRSIEEGNNHLCTVH